MHIAITLQPYIKPLITLTLFTVTNQELVSYSKNNNKSNKKRQQINWINTVHKFWLRHKSEKQIKLYCGSCSVVTKPPQLVLGRNKSLQVFLSLHTSEKTLWTFLQTPDALSWNAGSWMDEWEPWVPMLAVRSSPGKDITEESNWDCDICSNTTHILLAAARPS